MIADLDVSPIGPVLTLLGTFGGVWVVVFLFRRFQTDFADQYRQELVKERERRTTAEERLYHEQVENARLLALLVKHDIDPTPGGFNATHD